MILIIVAIIVFLINLPFGYWRANTEKFSVQWFLSVHLPIPFIILLRIYSGIGFQFITYPVLVLAFFLGQLAGSKYYLKRKLAGFKPISSCLVMDVYRKTK